jgi:CPA2 family monovalent cation:H+ antiporter-2
MPHANEFLTSLALVLCVAAVTTVVFQRLHQPVVFGYLLAGMIVGPYVPVPLEAHPETVETLAELGVILLLGLTLALLALPARADPKVDLAAAPRRALVVAPQLAIVCVVGTPLLALAQLFLPPIRAPVIVAAIIAILVGVLWRHASDLQAHARAGAEALVSLLKRQMAPLAGSSESNSLAEAHGALPGLGEPIFVRLRPGDYGVGRTLRELDLRSVTGAMVLSIAREGDALMLPVGGDQLRAGDALAVAGTTEAIDAARRLLQPGPSAAA